MKRPLTIGFLLLSLAGHAQKRFSEGTITYEVTTFESGNAIGSPSTAVHYLKGSHVRMDMIGKLGSSMAIFDGREGSGALVKTFGEQRILIPVNKQEWGDRNSYLDALDFVRLDTTIEILGYPCQRAVAEVAGSSKVVAFYTSDIIMENTDTRVQFGNLPGMVLLYRYEREKVVVEFRAKSVFFDPVPIQKFDIPSKGYRIMDYQESKLLGLK